MQLMQCNECGKICQLKRVDDPKCLFCLSDDVVCEDIEMPLMQPEFLDINKVLEMGAKKYSPNGWLEPDGKRASFKNYHDSAFHHLGQSYAAGRKGKRRLDDQSQLDHLLHAAVNCLMCYTRLKRKLKHPEDV